MDIREAIEARHSIRGFKSDPVSRETINDILKLAVRAPTGKNIQPWEFIVLTGSLLKRISLDNVAALLNNEPERPDVPIAYPTGKFKEREVQNAKAILDSMGIQREDKDKRLEWWQRGFRYFDAPAVVLILCHQEVDPLLAHHDVGTFSQTFCLAALGYGLGTCIVRQGILYADVIRRHIRVSANKLIISAIAIGYPDPEFPANQVYSDRLQTETLTTWIGF